jgi:formamidopyrimidine-DNA glycosylase
LPELPDLTVYIDALLTHVVGTPVRDVRVRSPFVLRSVDPPPSAIVGRAALGVSRIGKRIALAFDGELFVVIHLMIAGRLRWRPTGRALGLSAKMVLATFGFDHGTLFFTEAGSKKRASLQLLRGSSALAAVDPGGLDPLAATADEFHQTLVRHNHTLKRTLTDPHVFSGIGNAYSDEILHAAKLSPLRQTQSLTAEEAGRLHEATRRTLTDWIARLRREAAGAFPETVSAFRDEMAVHGRYKQACPACGAPVQRIVYANNECNYCARCQTGGRLLADRSLSRLLKGDWPRSIDDL